MPSMVKNTLGSFLYSDRFNNKSKHKKIVQRNSVLEYGGLKKLNEKLNVENNNINVDEYSMGIDYNLSIPPRIPYENIEREIYAEIEMEIFNRWKYMNRDKVFERNLEVWRQFWLVCEKSDILCQIVDIRNMEKYYNGDIKKMYPDKKHIILCNKSDLTEESLHRSVIDGCEIFYYTTREGDSVDTTNNCTFEYVKNIPFEKVLRGNVGFVGYPNVGKSSTINMIMKHKKVKVSSTPGKTRYLQTIEGDGFVLYDCPGLVFPKHTKIDLILMGVFNVDQCMDINSYKNDIIKYIGEDKVRRYCNEIGEELEMDTKRLKRLLKEFMENNLK